MSHLTKIEIEINDIKALKKACQRLGLEFRETQKTFRWYGREPAPCDHTISIPSDGSYDNENAYEIGVIKNGKNFDLQCDFWNRTLKSKIGENGGLFKQAYALEKAKMEAIKKGYSVRERRMGDKIELRIQVR